MILGIILLLITGVGIYLVIDDRNYYNLGVSTILIGGCFLFIHMTAFSLRGYNYRIDKAKYNAFTETLANARTNDNQYEVAAITKEVAEWNQRLAVIKFQNKTLFLDQYISDRYDNLKLIK